MISVIVEKKWVRAGVGRGNYRSLGECGVVQISNSRNR
jgi:hypothetical protein